MKILKYTASFSSERSEELPKQDGAVPSQMTVLKRLRERRMFPTVTVDTFLS